MRAIKSMGAGMVERYGDRPGRNADEPAFTIRGSAGGMEPGGFRWQPEEGDEMTWGYRDRPAPTVTGGGGKASGIELFDQQSRKKMLMAIENDEMIGNGRVVNPKTPLDPIRCTPGEAATLQTYPPDESFVWVGAKTKTFLQIGNAVPPLLVEHVLESLWAPAEPVALAEVIAFPQPVAVVLDAAA